MTSLGFTGTRKGMDPTQLNQFLKLITKIRPEEFHVGDCIGADKEAA
jgi:hypothetical protein